MSDAQSQDLNLPSKENLQRIADGLVQFHQTVMRELAEKREREAASQKQAA